MSKLFCPLDKNKKWAVVTRSIWRNIEVAHRCETIVSKDGDDSDTLRDQLRAAAYYTTNKPHFYSCRANRVSYSCYVCGERSSKTIHNKAKFIIESMTNDQNAIS